MLVAGTSGGAGDIGRQETEKATVKRGNAIVVVAMALIAMVVVSRIPRGS